MGLRLRCFYVSWYILLVALTCLSQEHSPREKRFLWKPIEETLKGVGERINAGLNSIFQQRAENEDLVDWTTTEEPTSIEDPNYKRIITAPLRCPPDYVLVLGRCRRQLR